MQLPTTYNNRGNSYYLSQEYEKAIQDYNQAINLNPHYCECYYNRGLAYQKIQENQKATTDFKQALDLAKQQGNAIVYREIQAAIAKLV